MLHPNRPASLTVRECDFFSCILVHGIVAGFDNVFLEIVQEIKTEQDRLDAIQELQSFIVSQQLTSQIDAQFSYGMF
jgi:hypothetical protein